ncbi:uncharacterized protein EHS24_002615 [Apiotrichum porosum]|uniref:Uncharacterized protein n=1 Tax=Apiotrichum porosum TaxID=105984 RepID=A0A427XH24_9TREE|nr:uncharacterized protein EHS24_002615 [Apiotrichum porosum]RSH78158.1 hypothetical protein EHS24_002615 [Apiotrichum porosum]
MQQRVFERPIIGPEGWIGVVDLLIAFCYERALQRICARFPNASEDDIATHTAPLSAVKAFAQGAMDCLWRDHYSDGGKIKYRGFNVDTLKGYLPDPCTLPPRAFVCMDPDRPDLPAETIWLDYKYEIVPPPNNSPSLQAQLGSRLVGDVEPVVCGALAAVGITASLRQPPKASYLHYDGAVHSAALDMRTTDLDERCGAVIELKRQRHSTTTRCKRLGETTAPPEVTEPTRDSTTYSVQP